MHPNLGTTAWPVGMRVRFTGRSWSYGGKIADGEEGSVIAVPVGGKPSTYVPGPGGGLVYVEWDRAGILAVQTPDVDALSRSQVANARRPRSFEEARGSERVPLVDTIRRGDRVTIVSRFGQEHTGTAVMRGPHGWVLNMGGRHGRPDIASDENTVRVRTPARREECETCGDIDCTCEDYRENASKRWSVFVNDRTGVRRDEGLHFATRQKAEEFAAARSRFRRDGNIIVNRFGEQFWTSVYRNGWLIDTQDGKSWVPESQQRERERLRDLYELKPNARTPKGPFIVELSAVGNPDHDEPEDIGVPTRRVAVEDLRAASNAVQDYITEHDLGGGNWNGGRVYQPGGKLVARISYNGRIWAMDEGEPGQCEIIPNARLGTELPAGSGRWKRTDVGGIERWVPMEGVEYEVFPTRDGGFYVNLQGSSLQIGNLPAWAKKSAVQPRHGYLQDGSIAVFPRLAIAQTVAEGHWKENQARIREVLQRPNAGDPRGLMWSGAGQHWVWLMRKGSNEPLETEGPYGPYPLDNAKKFARIGAREGKHDRAVSRGQDPRAESFKIEAIYQAGSGERIV